MPSRLKPDQEKQKSALSASTRAVSAFDHSNACAIHLINYMIEAALKIAIHMVESLEATHAKIIFQDELKPANLVKIFDFGWKIYRADIYP